jgi:hypothetical protein
MGMEESSVEEVSREKEHASTPNVPSAKLETALNPAAPASTDSGIPVIEMALERGSEPPATVLSPVPVHQC